MCRMKFTDICLISEDVLRLAKFYEAVFQTKAEGNAVHSYLQTDGAGIALYAKRSAETDMSFNFSVYNGTGTFTIGFNVEDVDTQYERIRAIGAEFVSRPTTWPWGARSMLFRDPDGNIITFRSWPK